MRKYWLGALALLLPAAANAEWMEAASDNFVIYADDSESDIRRLSGQLELYHAAMEKLTGTDLPVPSPSNRVTIYVVRSQREVARLFGQNGRNVGAFYMPRAGGSVAVVPGGQASGGRLDFPMIALLHEYAHHFLTSISTMPMPIWFSEGAAEFFASAEFPAKGGISVGRPATHRAAELFLLKDVKAAQLIEAGPDFYQQGITRGFESFYGKSWLLFHYLMFEEARSGQLAKYTALLSAGKNSRQAGEEAFGSLNQLEMELDRYVERRGLLQYEFPPADFAVGQAKVRTLSVGEAQATPLRIRLRRGVAPGQAPELLADARELAGKFPGDPAVLSTLAEAEFAAGNDAEAVVAADAALALDPAQVNAYVHKGSALFRQAAAAQDKTAAYRKAVAPFLALNKIENDHPLPLVYFYRSFAERSVRPSEQAVLGLERAAELAPFDLGLRLNLAAHHIQAGEFVPARINLEPIAFNPHGGPQAESARRVIERIDAGNPQPPELLALLGPPSTAAGGGQ